MASNFRISENSITSEAPITIYIDSKDAVFLDPKKYRGVEGKIISNSLSGSILDPSGLFVGGGDAEGEPQENNVPQLEDIQVVENTTYVDDKGVTRGKIVLKVRNSSGKPLLGVDARKAVLASAGGQG